MITTPKSEKRQNERYPVQWPGMLTCLFPSHEESVEVSISEISCTGARIEMEKLRVGPYHIVVASESSEFTLHVNIPGVELSSPVRIVWYSMNENKQAFTLGVLFPNAACGWNAIEKELQKQ